MILRVLDAFRPRGATWSGQVISSPRGPSGGPSKTHLLPGGGVPRVHRARSPVPPRLPRFATPRSVHPFAAVANAPALFQEQMHKILYILRRRPLVQELVSRGAEMEAHINDVSLGTNTQEDHILLLQEFFTVCQEKHLRI